MRWKRAAYFFLLALETEADVFIRKRHVEMVIVYERPITLVPSENDGEAATFAESSARTSDRDTRRVE